MKISFVRSGFPDGYSSMVYAVWSDQYHGIENPIGFISRNILKDMEEYFLENGYEVEVFHKPQDHLKEREQLELFI